MAQANASASDPGCLMRGCARFSRAASEMWKMDEYRNYLVPIKPIEKSALERLRDWG